MNSTNNGEVTVLTDRSDLPDNLRIILLLLLFMLILYTVFSQSQEENFKSPLFC